MLTVTDVADHGDGYLPVDAHRTLIRPEREWWVEWEGVGAKEGNPWGIPVQAKAVEMPESSLAFFDLIEALPNENKNPPKTYNHI